MNRMLLVHEMLGIVFHFVEVGRPTSGPLQIQLVYNGNVEKKIAQQLKRLSMAEVEYSRRHSVECKIRDPGSSMLLFRRRSRRGDLGMDRIFVQTRAPLPQNP